MPSIPRDVTANYFANISTAAKNEFDECIAFKFTLAHHFKVPVNSSKTAHRKVQVTGIK